MGEENNQIVLIFVLSAAFVVFLAILLVLFLVIYQKRIVTQESRLQKLQNERQQMLLEATIEGQERERERLAKDLHDGIGSLLSGLRLHLKFHKNKEDSTSERAKFLAEACEIVDEGIKNVRSVSHNLMPATLERFGLVTAMKECVETINKSIGLAVSINTINEPYKLAKEIDLGLLRVFQELIQNTIKHSNATAAIVSITFAVDFISIHYQDNGQGINLDKIDKNGIGIKNMQSRIQALKGRFSIDDSFLDGFAVHIRVPINLNMSEI